MKTEIDTSKIVRAPRFLHLARFLGSRSAALGTLILLFEHAAEDEDCERPFYFSLDDVEVACDWQGERRRLADILLHLDYVERGDNGVLADVFEVALAPLEG